MTRTGGPEVFEVRERPDPAVGAGEVRIAVRAAGLNFADTMARVGAVPRPRRRPPCVLGYEVAGEVETIGEGVTGFAVGQRVMAGTQFGGQAELATAQARDVMPMPDHLSFEEGAAFCVNYATAYAALIIMGGLRDAGPGADPLRGRRGRDSPRPRSPATSARRSSAPPRRPSTRPSRPRACTIRSTTAHQDFKAEVRRLTNGEGVDVILDAMGPTSFRKDYRILRPGGRLIMYGLSEALNEKRPQHRATRGEPAADPDLDDALVERRPAAEPEPRRVRAQPAQLVAARGRHGPDHRAAAQRSRRAGRLVPVVARSFPFDRAGDAHRYLAERRNIGKVVLTPH